jgi:hypothetical protein
VASQAAFVPPASTLPHLFLRQQGQAELNRQTRPRVREQLLPSAAVILIYCQHRVATLAPLEYTEPLLAAPANPRPPSSSQAGAPPPTRLRELGSR